MEQPLTTKLFIPPLRSKRISRPRLIERINSILERKLFLISAPAGFGKTTLVSEWISISGNRVAWLSLDEGDSDLARFLTYFISALQTIVPDIGTQASGMLASPQPLATGLILSSLINEIANVPEDLFLVLDDFHVIEETQIDEALIFMLENLPPHFHLIITTREDPLLPLARFRARNQLAELRAADLRFTYAEAASFLNEVMDLNLSEADIGKLESRTEGWIAGLQLAGLSMQDYDDKTDFIQSFTGSHQFVMDFLVEEVLEHQAESIQNFLLQTSILDRLNSSLCDAVIADPSISGQETLEYLTQANLFLLPLDNERQWYRYHHLFADLLRRRLQENSDYSKGKEGNHLAELHLRASKWFEEKNLLLEAFEHAVAAKDIDRAACLMEGKGMPLQYRGAAPPILNWLKSLPEETLNTKPSLRVAYTSTLTILGKPVDNIEEILRKAELGLGNSKQDEITRDYIGQIAAIRAMLAIPRNQVEEIITQSHRALEYLHPDNLPVRTNAAWALGHAHQLKGDRTAAKEDLQQALSTSQASGNIIISIASLTNLGQLYELENQLELAEDRYSQVLELAGKPPLPYACAALVGLAQISYEQNKLAAAKLCAQESLNLAQQLENIDTPILCHLLFARVNLARGEFAEAEKAIQSAEQFARQNQITHRLPEITAAQARFYLQLGGVDKALDVIKKHELPLIKARIFLAQEDPASALAVLEPIQEQMEDRNWLAELLEVLILETLAYQMLGDKSQAVSTLENALSLAKPGNFVRSFIDEGPQMAQLISGAALPPDLFSYREKLLAEFKSIKQVSQTSPTSGTQSLIEPLSKREIEILHLISQGYSNSEIGKQLYLALNTVKGYNRKLFQKLNAKNRTEAVANAQKLGLL